MTQTPTPSPPRPSRPDGASSRAWTLGSLRGVPVRVDRSLALIAALIAYQFYARLDVVLSGRGPGVVLTAALAASVLLFASILAHEIGHAVTSLNRGIPVASITLFALGGVTESTREAASPRDEFVIVGIGPFISLVLGAAVRAAHPAVAPLPPVAAVTGYLAWTNVLLAIFNVVPGYPLDGGRLLRALLWGISGRPHAATRWAARVGQAFAILLIAWSLRAFIGAGGGGFGGLFNILIGSFLLRGATDAHRRARMRERLAARTVGDVMGSVPPTLPAQLSLAQALPQVQERPSLLWPVGTPLVGAVTLEQFDAVAADTWPATTLGEVAQPADAVTVDVAVSLDAALDRLVAAPGAMLVVVDGGQPVGLLTLSLVSDLLR